MAKIIENKKSFKIIEMSNKECIEHFLTPAGVFDIPICDSCCKPYEKGFYIPVLLRWYCQECYDEFTERQSPFESDKLFEEKEFNRMCKKLNLKNGN